MLTFITDRQTRRDGTQERDLLTGRRLAPLVIRSLEGEKIAEVLPSGPWTHDTLTGLVPGLEAMFADQLKQGADAYLGGQWVGGTEV